MERSLPAPTTFNINAIDLYSEWKHWVSAFEIYAIASDLKKKEDAAQRATMLHCLGPAVQRIFNTLPGENKSLEEVKSALSGYFAPKWNVVAERYKFRSRAQKADESIDACLTSLRVGEILQLRHSRGGDDKGQDCCEMFFSSPKAETAPAGRPWPG